MKYEYMMTTMVPSYTSYGSMNATIPPPDSRPGWRIRDSYCVRSGRSVVKQQLPTAGYMQTANDTENEHNHIIMIWELPIHENPL